MAQITGLSIRTLRYYDEIGLLKPTQLTPAGYRLYDDKALEKSMEIMFFRELDIPLATVKEIMDSPHYDKEQALLTQRSLLEQKRNRLNGVISLINDVLKGVDTMSFEAFTDNDVQQIIDHSIKHLDKDEADALIKKFGSLKAYRSCLAKNLKDQKANARFIKLYGSKDKALKASLQSTGDKKEFKKYQEQNDKIYKQFALALKTKDNTLAIDAVERLGKNYKSMFRLDNPRALLLEVAKDYLQDSMLTKAAEKQYGAGITEYIAQAIQRYYGA